METTIAFNSLVLGSLPARHARYRPRHTAVVVAPRAKGAHEIRLTWREFDALRQPLRECARGARRRARRSRGDRARELARAARDLLGLREARRRRGAAVAAPDRDGPRIAARRRAAEGRARLVGPAAGAGRRAAPATVHALVGAGRRGGRRRGRRLPRLRPPARRGERRARRAAHVEAGDLLTLMYTSGTTGLPKGIQHTHFIRAMYATTMANAWRMAPESVVLHSGAIVFNGAMVTMFPAFMVGATYVLHRAFDAEAFIDTVERERVTHTMLVPSQIIAILNAKGFDPARLTSLEMVLSLGAPLHEGAQGPAERAPAATLLRALRADRGLRHDPRPRRRAAQGGQRRRAAAVLRDADRRRRRPRRAAGNDRRDRRARSDHDARATTTASSRPRRRCATAGSTPATWATSTRTASSISSTARRT